MFTNYTSRPPSAEEFQAQEMKIKEMADINETRIRELKEELEAVREEFRQLMPLPERDEFVEDRNPQQNDYRTFTLEEDTFALMMLSKVLSEAWALGIVALTFQIVLGIMIAYDQIAISAGSSLFNVPFKVDAVVRVGQFSVVIISLSRESDILGALQCLLMLRRGSNWNEVIREPEKSNRLWLIRILLPNLFKMTEGSLVMFISFVVIVQSDNIIDLLKDFTALMVLAETDNVLFGLAKYGYLGETLENKTTHVSETEIRPPKNDMDDKASSHRTIFRVRSALLVCVFTPMLGGWLAIVMNQINGEFFYDRYPKCNSTDDAFELANQHFGDGVCYGGPLNNLGCEFEGGDCVNFNLAFPLCKGDDRINVQESVGNGTCEVMFMSADCDYDGGDCCPYDIINNPSFGNGECNGGMMASMECGYDNTDCFSFINQFSKCPLTSLARNSGADAVVFGDGDCDGGIYNIWTCGYEYGDCNYGQLGQSMKRKFKISEDGQLFFSNVLSLDGTTMAIGTHFLGTSRVVSIWRYDSNRMMWMVLSKGIVYSQGKNALGRFEVSLSANGNRIMVPRPGGMQVYGFNESLGDEDWSEVGQRIIPSPSLSFPAGTMTADGSKVAVVYSRDEIRIYELKSAPPSDDSHHEWVNDGYNIIYPGVGLNARTNGLEFNSLDGSTLLLTTGSDYDGNYTNAAKVFRFNADATSTTWTQMGQDIESQNSTILLSASISADGNRIAVSFNSTFDTLNGVGEVIVLDYDNINDDWVPIGSPIQSSLSENYGFGYSINMSSDGNLLVVGSNSPGCQPFPTEFFMNDCPIGNAELFNYHAPSKSFYRVPPNARSPYRSNIMRMGALLDSTSSGLHYSMDGSGNVLSVSGFDMGTKEMIVETYDLEALFYSKCVVEDFNDIRNRICDKSYNNQECEWDGLDCTDFNERYPNCETEYPSTIGNGKCENWAGQKTEACGWDGGDC